MSDDHRIPNDWERHEPDHSWARENITITDVDEDGDIEMCLDGWISADPSTYAYVPAAVLAANLAAAEGMALHASMRSPGHRTAVHARARSENRH